MRARRRQRNRLNSDMNIVPYVDVMFVLLTIFMVTATTISVGVDVDPPKMESGMTVAIEGDEMMVISVNAMGDFFFNQSSDPAQALDEATILSLADQFYQDNPTATALVKGDQHAPYGKVIDAMSLLQRVTEQKVQLMTLPALESEQKEAL